jgi:aspartate aminotransferase-like enzyme
VALEAAITSVVEEGDRVLNVVCGTFGSWMAEMTERVGGEPVVFEVGWGVPIDLKKLEDRLKSGRFRALTVVHNETATGSMYPVEEVVSLAHRYGALSLVDTVSSLGGVDIKTDEWGIDLNMSSSQKCMAGPIGLALVAVSARAWESMEKRKKPSTSFSLDLLRWKKMWIPKERGGDLIHGWRRQAVSMPVHLVYALQEAVEMILEEGVQKRFRRHRSIAAAFRAGVRAMNLEIPTHESIYSDTLTCIKPPDGIPASNIISFMREKYGIVVAGGLDKWRDTVIRVGHMGVTASPNCILPTLSALEDALYSLGYKGVKRGRAAKEAQDVIGEN